MNPCLFWAKLGDETWPAIYHPVLCHLIDVGAVAHYLWKKVLRSCVQTRIARQLGLADIDATGAWLAFWAATHDIGKISPCFQHRDGRTEALRQQLTASGFNFPTGNKPHGDISTVVLASALESGDGMWPGVSRKAAQAIAVAVGGHHGFFPTNWDQIADPLGNSCWVAARRAILAELARLFGVTGLQPPCPGTADDQSVWMFVAGLTSVADWIGSNITFFPPVGNKGLVDRPFDVDAYFAAAGDSALTALDSLGWLGRSPATSEVTFGELFPIITQPRPLQTAVEAVSVAATEPGLLIVEAPMGEGKTEAAWYAAACWDRRGGQGTYVALPTMATSNQMLDRVKDFLACDGEEGKKNVMLLHGKAAVHDKFAELKYAATVYSPDGSTSAVVAEGWFAANKKHGLLAPFGVGTIDQVLLAVLQTKHVFVRLFGLAGKCVILDEVHAYDAYMTTLLGRLLRWLAALGCPVVLLSATLPRARRHALIEAYAPGATLQGDGATYPRITVVRPDGYMEQHVDADPARARTVRLDWVQEERLVEELRASLADGGCAVVIRNTVGLAQQTFVQLRGGLGSDGIAVELFHARFPFGRRMEIENAVLQRFGKDGGPAERNKRVLVATQVVEQSLDLDFDLMVSDVAPVDLVLQRAGRLHRHARGPRPAAVNEPRLLLIEPGVKDGLPEFGPSEYVNARFVLLRSFVALRAANGVVRLPGDLERLVERVYGAEPLEVPDAWQAALADAQQELEMQQRQLRRNAKSVMIPKHDDETLLWQQSAMLDEDNPAAHDKIRAATRDCQPTVQLILVYRIAGNDYLDLAGQEPFDEATKPDLQRIRRLLKNEIAISHGGCVADYYRRDPPAGWQDCGMLRHHRVLRVDSQGHSLPGNFRLRYYPDTGVELTD